MQQAELRNRSRCNADVDDVTDWLSGSCLACDHEESTPCPEGEGE